MVYVYLWWFFKCSVPYKVICLVCFNAMCFSSIAVLSYFNETVV